MTRTDPPLDAASAAARGWSAQLQARLFQPLDSAWLSAFRIVYGLALGISMLRFLVYGWVEEFFVKPSFFFKYWGFEWVEPLSAGHMHALFWVLAAAAFAVALGAAFRIAAPVLALGLSYFQLIDVSTYLNHYYLAALLAWLLCVSPAHRAWSVDAWLKARFARWASKARSGSGVNLGVPANTQVSAAWLYLFRFQVGVVYTFAGLAKAQSDWLIHAQPLRIWLGANTSIPILGPLFTIEGVPLLMSWCGFLFDTTIVWWLLYRRTRPWAYGVVILFHVLTRVLFPIGMFPVIMVLSALVFFSPSWPRHLMQRLQQLARRIKLVHGKTAATVAPFQPSLQNISVTRWQKLGACLGILYCGLQLAMPVRYLGYGGNVLWHEQGMRFSWRVMLRAKGGNTTFIVHNKTTGREWHVSPRTYLTGMQESEMSSQPDLILQLAHHIHRDFERRGLGPVEVRAESRVSLNGRRSAPFIDPAIDLVSVRDGISRANWVLPHPTQAPPRTKPVL